MIPGESKAQQTDFFITVFHTSHDNNYGIRLFFLFLKLFKFRIIHMPTLLFTVGYLHTS